MKAIRKDLISEREPNHVIGEMKFPKAMLTFWGIGALDLLHVGTGAFIATGTSRPIGLTIPVVRFNVGNV